MPVEIKLPAIDSDFNAGTIVSWAKSVGDPVEIGDVMFEIETDKAVVEVEAQHSGILGQIMMEAGTSDIPVHSTVGILLNSDESLNNLNSNKDFQTPAAKEPQTTTNGSEQVRIFSSPLARNLAAKNSVDITQLHGKGRGPNGRILKADVEAFMAAAPAPTAVPSPTIAPPLEPKSPVQSEINPQISSDKVGSPIKHSAMRRTIAERLGQSKREIPHFYLTVECEVDKLEELRRTLNVESPQGDGGFKLTINDFIIKACALALRDVPEVNARWTEDSVLPYNDVDISVAVSTKDGLITPIVQKADTKGLAVISREIKALANKAKIGKLQPHEYKGGGFSISNLGMYGIKTFSAIINPPQSSILAIGAAEKRPVVKNDSLAIATILDCTLAADHRIVDGVVGSKFLQAVKHYIEKPMHMLLEGG